MNQSGWKAECLSPAKLNITLDVHRPDATGFHPIDSIVVRLNLSDEMIFTVRSGIRGVRLVLQQVRPRSLEYPHRGARRFLFRGVLRRTPLRPPAPSRE